MLNTGGIINFRGMCVCVCVCVVCVHTATCVCVGLVAAL